MDLVQGALNTTNVDMRSAHVAPGANFEPLVDRWYACPHLMAAAQRALNLAFRYLPTLRSFIDSPDVHAAAAEDPATFGGPLMGLPASRLAAAKDYLASTEAARAEALRFAQVIRDLDLSIQRASGSSLNRQRDAAPESLRGRIELVYALNDCLKIRLLEEVFVEDDLGHSKAQELRIHRQPDVERDFFLSTPRLDDASALVLNTASSSEAAARLYRSRYAGTNVLDLASALGVAFEDLAPWFASAPNPVGQRYGGPG